MFSEMEEIGGLLGLWRPYVALPVGIIESTEFARSDLTAAVSWLRDWHARRGAKARGVSLIVMAEPRHEVAAREWIAALFNDPRLAELCSALPVEVTLMDDGAGIVERFQPPAHSAHC